MLDLGSNRPDQQDYMNLHAALATLKNLAQSTNDKNIKSHCDFAANIIEKIMGGSDE